MNTAAVLCLTLVPSLLPPDPEPEPVAVAVGPVTADLFGLNDRLGWRVPLPTNWSADGIFTLHGLDYDSRNVRDDQVEVDRATFYLTGANEGGVAWRVSPDLAGRDTAYGLEEAFLELQGDSPWRFRLGLQRLAIGPEFSVREESLPFVGYSFPAYLSGRSDIAARFDRSWFEDTLDVDVAFALGEGFDPAGEPLQDPELRIRVSGTPLRGRRLELFGTELSFDGLTLSAGFAHSFDPRAELDVLHPLRTKLFDTPNLDADSGRKLHFGLGWEGERFSFAHEFVFASLLDLEVPGGGKEDLENQITAFTTSLLYRVTGWYETPRVRAFDDPSLFDAAGGSFTQRTVTPGAVDIGLRYSNADIDRRLFETGLASYDVSSQEFRTITAAVNWYPEEDLRVTLEAVRTVADDDIAALGGGGRDTSFVLALQWFF